VQAKRDELQASAGTRSAATQPTAAYDSQSTAVYDQSVGATSYDPDNRY
jgi:hypothetical protein